LYKSTCYEKKVLNNKGQQFHQYQPIKQPFLTSQLLNTK